VEESWICLSERGSVTQSEEMIDAGAHESNTGTASVTGNSERTTKGKVVGEKRKRSSYTSTQTVFLEQALGKGELDRKKGRQKVADVFTKESGEKFDPLRIKTWHRNHKSKLQRV
jgi:hypothetical protein